MGEVWYFTKVQIRHCFTSARFYVIFFVLAAVLWSFFGGVAASLESEETSLQFCELFVLFSGSQYPQRIIILVAALLLADAPFLYEGISYRLARSTKAKWYLGQLLYCAIMTVLLLIAFQIVLLLLTGGRVTFQNEWSAKFVQLCTNKENGIYEFEPLGIILSVDFNSNLIHGGTPYFTFTVSMLYAFLMILSCCTLGMLVNLHVRTGAGALISVVYIGLPWISSSSEGLEKVLSPISPCYLASVGNRLISSGTILYTVLFFGCLILVSSAFGYQKLHTVDMQKEVHR